MLRVAVMGADAADWQVVAARVRHACLERCAGRWNADPAWESAEAVAFIGDAPLDHDSIVSALAGGRHVLLATQSLPPLSELERWFQLAMSHRVRLDVVNPQLARPSRRLIRQQIDNGKLGEVGLVRISRSVSLRPSVDRGNPAARVATAMLADVDLVMWLIGRAPNTVFAIRRRVETGTAPHGECLHVHLGFANGSSALIMATAAPPGSDESESLSVIARSGAAYADDHQNRQLLFGSGAATAPRAEEGDAVALLLDEFAVRVPGPFDPSLELRRWQNLAAVRAAVDQSADLQQALNLELD